MDTVDNSATYPQPVVDNSAQIGPVRLKHSEIIYYNSGLTYDNVYAILYSSRAGRNKSRREARRWSSTTKRCSA